MTSVTVGIGEQRLERPEPGDLVGELLEQRVEPRRGEQRLLVAEQLAEACAAARLGVGRRRRRRPASTSRRWTRCLSTPSSVGRGTRARATTRHAALTVATGADADPADEVGRGPRQRLGEPGRQHAGVDRPRDRVLHRDPGEHRQIEHLADLARRRSDRPGSSSSTTPAVCSSGGAWTARRSAR